MPSNSANKKKNTEKKPISKKKVALIVGVSVVAVILALLITVYAVFLHFYNKMTIETADTGTLDLRELTAIFSILLDYHVYVRVCLLSQADLSQMYLTFLII